MWLAGRLNEMEAALARLVEVNSHTSNVEGGNEVGRRLAELFTVPGLSAEKIASARFADHWVFRSKGRLGVAPIVLIGHLDTVFPRGKFEGYRVDGKLRRGPGVLDMKGGLVTVAYALKSLAQYEGGLDRLPPLKVVIVSDEEVGSPDSRPHLERELAGAQAALVFESGRANDAIVTQRKGTGQLEVKVRGKAAHAGNAHEQGANALWALARFIDKAQQLTDYARGVTVNVGKVTGGQGKNTVPDDAVAEVDLRFSTRGDGTWLLDALHAAAREASDSVKGTSVEIDGGLSRPPMERTPQSVALYEAYAKHAVRHGLAASESPRVGGGSDGCTASALGVPCIDALGPRGRGFHTLDEQIEVDTLIPRAQALADFLFSHGA